MCVKKNVMKNAQGVVILESHKTTFEVPQQTLYTIHHTKYTMYNTPYTTHNPIYNIHHIWQMYHMASKAT